MLQCSKTLAKRDFEMSEDNASDAFGNYPNLACDWAEYWVDSVQKSVLILDILRKRGNNYVERAHAVVPNVLEFEAKVLVDGRSLPRPVNYFLVEIVPGPEYSIDAQKRPFIVVDPRAGHGPGIGGMKHDSEIGKALEAGHPCYFVGFTPSPVEGQTVADVCAAEAHFVKTVIERHPRTDGLPVVIGNCQAGWQIMMTAAARPELFGPIMLAGSPLSYWAGIRGKNPMRYSGGILGGTWLNALTGDLGNGLFDGAHLVANFESLNPANTLWSKPYKVYNKVDTEAERFIDFEKWWGSPVLLTADEMLSIANDLFVGNKLSRGQIQAPDGTRLDLRNIMSPIIVFCSWGDDITPPPQALQWITDLYDTDEDLRASGQTIVYCLHRTIGHLGIFVSGKVATKEHAEFAQAMDAIDLLGPGIYEAVIEDIDEHLARRDLVEGDHLFTLERRSLEDIRDICQQNPEDDRRFASAARLSDINLAFYREFARPAVRAVTSDLTGEIGRRLHPNRLRFELFSDENPVMRTVPALADAVRENRRPVRRDNPFVQAEHMAADFIEGSLTAFGKAVDAWKEVTFLATYGHPVVQALAGIDAATSVEGPAERDLPREALVAIREKDLRQRVRTGGPLEAALRALIWVAMTVDRADERMFRAVVDATKTVPLFRQAGLPAVRQALRDQQAIIELAPDEAIAAIPHLAGPDPEARVRILSGLDKLFAIDSKMLGEEGIERLATLHGLLSPGVAAKGVSAI
jgi:hypothetical protein